MGQEIYIPASELNTALARAHKESGVVAALYTSDRCPFCIAIKKEQLTPRMRSDVKPMLIVVEFDVDQIRPFTLPSGSRITAKEWGKKHSLRLTPTLVMLDESGAPIGMPLVGYSSRDFYASYLETLIKEAEPRWQKQRH